VTVPETHGIEIIDTQTTEVAESELVGLTPMEGSLTPAGDQLWLSDSAAGRVLSIAIATRHEGPPISAGRNPGASRIDPSGELLLVANRDSNDLSIIDIAVASPRLITIVPVGQQPSDVAVLLF
jgi:YVTN family beta-propeller protein